MRAAEHTALPRDAGWPSVPPQQPVVRPHNEPLPMPGQPVQAHLQGLYPHFLADRQRLEYARPAHDLRVLFDPQCFADTLAALVLQLDASQRPADRQAARLLQGLLAERRALACCIHGLLKV